MRIKKINSYVSSQEFRGVNRDSPLNPHHTKLAGTAMHKTYTKIFFLTKS